MLYFFSAMLYDVIRHISSRHGSSINLILWHGCVHIHFSQHRSHLPQATINWHSQINPVIQIYPLSSAFEKYLLNLSARWKIWMYCTFRCRHPQWRTHSKSVLFHCHSLCSIDWFEVNMLFTLLLNSTPFPRNCE